MWARALLGETTTRRAAGSAGGRDHPHGTAWLIAGVEGEPRDALGVGRDLLGDVGVLQPGRVASDPDGDLDRQVGDRRAVMRRGGHDPAVDALVDARRDQHMQVESGRRRRHQPIGFDGIGRRRRRDRRVREADEKGARQGGAGKEPCSDVHGVPISKIDAVARS